MNYKRLIIGPTCGHLWESNNHSLSPWNVKLICRTSSGNLVKEFMSSCPLVPCLYPFSASSGLLLVVAVSVKKTYQPIARQHSTVLSTTLLDSDHTITNPYNFKIVFVTLWGSFTSPLSPDCGDFIDLRVLLRKH